MIRNLCDEYHKTPSEFENETPDQLIILTAKKSDLARLGGMGRIDVEMARDLGVIKPSGPSGPKSLVQRVRAAKQAEREQKKKLDKRQRRRDFDRQLKEARARGEV